METNGKGWEICWILLPGIVNYNNTFKCTCCSHLFPVYFVVSSYLEAENKKMQQWEQHETFKNY